MAQHEDRHRQEIIDQFSRQAIPFTQLPGHLDAVQVLVQSSGVSDRDHVLDVACGPGLVACEFARHAAHVTGIDITQAMIEQAQARQAKQGLRNLTWEVGDALPLPFADGSFSLVITRYSFHHFLEPARVLDEMIRVCRPSGRVLVADVAVPAECSVAYDRMESMRDPSHTHALTDNEFAELFAASDLVDCRRTSYDVEMELEAQLRASFPKPGDAERLRQIVTADVGVNALGVQARRDGEEIRFTYPIAVFWGRKETTKTRG